MEPHGATSGASATAPIDLLRDVGSHFDPCFNNQAEVTLLRPPLGEPALGFLPPPFSVLKKRRRRGQAPVHVSARVSVEI